jgi:hypothetical protein
MRWHCRVRGQQYAAARRRGRDHFAHQSEPAVRLRGNLRNVVLHQIGMVHDRPDMATRRMCQPRYAVGDRGDAGIKYRPTNDWHD